MPHIKITFEIVTPESAMEGEADERGWIDEEGTEIDGEWFEDDAQETRQDPIVLEAVKFLRNEGPVEASSWPSWHPGVWYTQADGNTDFRTGACETHSFHLYDFTEAQERAIFELITKAK